MTDDLAEDYPVAAPYIQKAVESMGEDWVIENYYPKISQLGLVMKIPEVEELPFYDEEKHSVMTKEERIQLAEAMSEYRKTFAQVRNPMKNNSQLLKMEGWKHRHRNERTPGLPPSEDMPKTISTLPGVIYTPLSTTNT